MYKISAKQRLSLIIFGFIVFIILLEAGLRIGGFIALFLQEHRNRVSIKQKDTYYIMCLGDSTTAFGGNYSYPSQLETILNEYNMDIKISVINKGRPGITSSRLLDRLSDNINKYKPDMVIIMMGINDIGERFPYDKIVSSKIIVFFASFKTYKLIKYLWFHIMNKIEEINNYNREVLVKSTQQGSPKRQEDILTENIRLNKIDDSLSMHMGLPEYYLEHKEYTNAEKILKKAIGINSNDIQAYIELGLLYEKQDKFEQAKRMFKQAMDLKSQHNIPYFLVGYFFERQGKFTKAEEAYKKSIEMNPLDSNSYFPLLRLYEKQEKIPKIKEILEKMSAELNSHTKSYPLLVGLLAQYYNKLGDNKLAEEYYKKMYEIVSVYYNPVTSDNYQRLKQIVTTKGIKLVCVQYPMRSIEPLKKMFDDTAGIIFVDNEKVFKEAVKQAGYGEYFTDMFAGDFGHCTRKGNRLLAENIADVILEEYFNK